MKLKASIKALGPYKGQTKFPFWGEIKEGDLLKVSVEVKTVPRSGRSLYSTLLVVENDKGEEFTDSMTRISKYLSNIEYQEV